MKLVFLGTRGYLEVRSARHRRHTSTLVVSRGRRVLIDCGEDWLGELDRVGPHAIVITHAHPDHAFGLALGAPCPVFATAEAWGKMARFAIPPVLRRVLAPRRPTRIEGIRFEAFPVVHSWRAPAVGYRISADGASIFYVPDVVSIPGRRAAFAGIAAYVGDGATLERPLIRRDKETGQPIGHIPVRTQIAWCAREGVPRMIVTHCGTPIVRADQRQIEDKLRRWGEARGVRVDLAYDGMEMELARKPAPAPPHPARRPGPRSSRASSRAPARRAS